MPKNMMMLDVLAKLMTLRLVENIPCEGLAALMEQEQLAQLRMLQVDTAIAWSIVTYKISVLPTPIDSIIAAVRLVLALA